MLSLPVDVLVIDDEPINQIVDALQRHGLHTIWMSCVDEIQKGILRGLGPPESNRRVTVDVTTPKLCLIDFYLGENLPNGHDIVKAIKNGGSKALIVSISSHQNMGMLDAGADLSILKVHVPSVVEAGAMPPAFCVSRYKDKSPYLARFSQIVNRTQA